MADILPYRRRSKARRKSRAMFARWNYLPWQPLAALLLIAATFASIQFVSTSTHQLSNEMDRSAIVESAPANEDAKPHAATQVANDSADESFTEVGQAGAKPVAVSNVSMPICKGWPRVNCVIDGDTIWYQGEKIRIADINAPETHDPQCSYEADLGRRATNRMIALLNAGPFEIVTTGERDQDVYGRKLRLIQRNGHSLGMTLVEEGLAERWQGYRRNWCI